MLPEIEKPEVAYIEPSIELVQASTGKRFANYIIDLVFFYMIVFFWSVVTAIISPSTIEGLGDGDNVFGSFWDRIIGLIAYAIVMSLIEVLFRGKSIGKLITGTKAVNDDGSDISFSKAFARGFTRAIPFEPLSALGSPCYPWHDKWTNTYVIDEKETRQHSERLTSI